MANAETRGSIWGAVIGVVVLAAWVVGSSFAYWLLVSSLSDEPDELLRSLTWPFVVILLGVPTLAILLVGGLRTLGHILSLREFLNELPQQVRTLETLAAGITKNRELFESSRNAISDAAGVIDQTTSQLADFESRIKKLGQTQETPVAPAAEEPDLVASLAAHLDKAKALFNSAAQQYSEKFGQGVERVQGWILESSVRTLKDSGTLSPAAANYVSAALDVDRRTRRSGRANLTANDIDQLNVLEPAAVESAG